MHRLDVHQPRTSTQIPLVPGDVVTQTFFSRYPNLDIVSLCLRNPDRILQPLTFTLRSADGTVLRTLPISSGNIDNQDCTKFQFAPLTDSANQTFQATVLVATGSSVITPNLRPVSVEAYTGTDYLQGTASHNLQDTGLDLHFKTFYSQSMAAVIQESLAQIPPRFMADPVFTLFYFGLLGWLLMKIIRRRP